MSSTPQVIHHLTPASELRDGCTSDAYAPARLPEDGFVHCSVGEAVTLAVASDYFADLDEPLFVLEIDVSKLRAALRFEAAAPIPGGGRAHRDGAKTFPHVYGPIDRAAIRAVGRLEKDAAGYRWPHRLGSLASVLDSI